MVRYASAVECEVSLPQHSNPDCTAIRNTALAQNKKIYTLKPASHGFALLNMTIPELAVVALTDPFSRSYTRSYIGLTGANNNIRDKYLNETARQEITDISEYLNISDFFQTVLEPVIGVNIMFLSPLYILTLFRPGGRNLPAETLTINIKVKAAKLRVYLKFNWEQFGMTCHC